MTESASKAVRTEQSAVSEPSTGRKQPVVLDDAVLVERCRRGDRAAFGLLVAKYQDRLYNMILRMCGRSADAEELAQETFLKAMQRIDQFHGRSQFYTWLFRIAANLTISHRRRKVRVRFHSLTSPSEDLDGPEGSLTAEIAERRNPNPEDSVIANETGERVLAALDELDDEFRIVVLLRDLEEMSYARIAGVIGIPVGTVKSRLHRARGLLREKLANFVRSSS